jgi:hypothetical protein
MQYLQQRMKINDIEFLKSEKNGEFTPVNDTLKRVELYREFIMWICNDYIIPLIKVFLIN